MAGILKSMVQELLKTQKPSITGRGRMFAGGTPFFDETAQHPGLESQELPAPNLQGADPGEMMPGLDQSRPGTVNLQTRGFSPHPTDPAVDTKAIAPSRLEASSEISPNASSTYVEPGSFRGLGGIGKRRKLTAASGETAPRLSGYTP